MVARLPGVRLVGAGLELSPKGYAGTDDSAIPPELETPLQEGGEVLRPDFAVRERDPREDAPARGCGPPSGHDEPAVRRLVAAPVLLRLFHDGAEADGLHLPPRHGDLFNLDRFPSTASGSPTAPSTWSRSVPSTRP